MPLFLAHLYWSLFPEDRSFCLKAHQADVDVIMTIRVTRAFVARSIGLPLPGKIDYYFSQLGRRMKRQEHILEGLQALEIDNGNTLEIPDQSIEEVGNEDLGAWEYDESGPTSEELNPISSSWKSQKSEILKCVTLRGGIMRRRSSGKLSTRLRINKATEYEVQVRCSLFSMKVICRLADGLI